MWILPVQLSLLLMLLGYSGDVKQQRQVDRREKRSIAVANLIPASTTMQTAWDIPRNPLTDSTMQRSDITGEIRSGFRLFIDTPRETPYRSHNMLACSNCHLNAGQREKALPLVGVAGMFPEYNKRAGRLFTLEDRIVECFKRSMDVDSDANSDLIPTTHAREVLALSAYITWLSAGYRVGEKIPWRGQNVIPPDKLIPVEKLDTNRGRRLFAEKCLDCHGEDGQGVEIGDKKAGPLWGDRSWNDGSGAARVHTLAGMIRYTMPYLDPGSLTDEEAQQIAAFIDSKARPVYQYKHEDYPGTAVPNDAVYYRRK